jgi:hypothetical protein
MHTETFTSPRRTIRRNQLREMVPLADTRYMRWSSAANFRDASLFRRAASFGTWMPDAEDPVVGRFVALVRDAARVQCLL